MKDLGVGIVFTNELLEGASRLAIGWVMASDGQLREQFTEDRLQSDRPRNR